MPTSLGRYPFPVAAKRYLEALEGHRAKVTLHQLERDLNTIGDDVRALYEAAKISTSNPFGMTVDDVAAVLAYWKTRPRRGVNQRGGTLDPTSQKHLWSALKKLLGFCGNAAPTQMKEQCPWVEIPQTLDKDVTTLDREELNRLRIGADTIPGWRGAVARFLVSFAPGTGLRPIELRLQELACVKPNEGCVLVCHPKGEGKYGKVHAPRPMSDDAVMAFRDFLPEREAFLAGANHPALIPFRHEDDSLDTWPSASVRKLKGEIERAAGVKFPGIKTFRATMGQMAKDAGASLEDISQALGHHSTNTTERYYVRVRAKGAVKRVRQALSGPRIDAR